MEQVFEYERNGIRMTATRDAVMHALATDLLGREPVITPLVYREGLGLPVVGALWEEEGGIYLGDIIGENEAPAGSLVGCIDPAGIFKNIAYGHYGDTIQGANWRRDGRANTVALAKGGNEFAIRVLDLGINGKKDWHWPAQYELNLACVNGGDHYAKEAYWASTQVGAINARYQVFEHGGSDWGSKVNRLSAFVVRRVPL